MADFLQDTADGSDLHQVNSVIESLQKKNSVAGSAGSAAATAASMAASTAAGNHMVSCTIAYYTKRGCRILAWAPEI